MKKEIQINLVNSNYKIIIEQNSFNNLNKYLNTALKTLIITDDNLYDLYYQKLFEQFKEVYFLKIKPGEASKNSQQLLEILDYMYSLNLDKKSQVIGFGGGVVGDISGLSAALYLRGINFILLPTTTLSQIDSSIGGKVAINYQDKKNLIGTFYQPQIVIIDTKLLATLDQYNYNCGLVEGFKMALLKDKSLVFDFLNLDLKKDIDLLIYKSIKIKKAIVEIDEFDNNERRLLNFGHTLGHSIEAYYKLGHGESILLGMIYTVTNEYIREILYHFGERINLKTSINLNKQLYEIMLYDKKRLNKKIIIANVDEIGKGYLSEYPLTYLKEIISGK